MVFVILLVILNAIMLKICWYFANTFANVDMKCDRNLFNFERRQVLCKFPQTLIFSTNIAELSQNCFILCGNTFCPDFVQINFVQKEQHSKLYVQRNILGILWRENCFRLCIKKCCIKCSVFFANKYISDCVQGKPEVRSGLNTWREARSTK